MSKEKSMENTSFSPQYFIIQKTEPSYDLITKQLLDPSGSPAGSSHYFIRADQDKRCICRIRAGNGTVLFYEILNHLRKGVSDEDIREALHNPANACPLPGYYYITPEIEGKLREFSLKDSAVYGIRHGNTNPGVKTCSDTIR
jgi:hypothetical protein